MALASTIGKTGLKIIDQDRGFRRAIRGVELLNGRSVKVGFMGGQEVDGVAVVDYATYNEFGTRNIPARPFMQKTSDDHKEETMDYAQTLVGAVIDGKTTVNSILPLIGEFYVSKMRMVIRQAKEWAAPNAPGTIARKGSASPLIDTGRMVNAISYEVT